MPSESNHSPAPPGEPNIVRFPAAQKSIAKRPAPAPGKSDDEEPLSTGALIGIGVFLVILVLTGVWLMNTLRDLGRMQDCAMQGRRNCAGIEVPARDR